MTNAELLDQIEAIRARNNTLHVDILRLAFEVAPERARAIVATIIDNDQQISELDRRLIGASS